jgi:hypothetical protein
MHGQRRNCCESALLVTVDNDILGRILEQEKLIKLATRIRAFMSLTDLRENSLHSIGNSTNPSFSFLRHECGSVAKI